MKRALFLDRDGTLIVDKSYMYKIEDLEIITEALDALKLFSEEGKYALVMVTNQSGIAQGKYTEEQFWTFQKEFEKRLAKEGVTFDGVYFCPHHIGKGVIPEYIVTCNCRKPLPGMLLQAQKDLGLVLDGSWMVGDKDEDVLTGKALGLNTVRIKSTYGYKEEINPSYTVNNLLHFYHFLNKDHEGIHEVSRGKREIR